MEWSRAGARKTNLSLVFLSLSPLLIASSLVRASLPVFTTLDDRAGFCFFSSIVSTSSIFWILLFKANPLLSSAPSRLIQQETDENWLSEWLNK
jgi:hypothetical protein